MTDTRRLCLPADPGPADPSQDGRGSLRDAGRYPRIYAIVRQIPRGRVATPRAREHLGLEPLPGADELPLSRPEG